MCSHRLSDMCVCVCAILTKDRYRFDEQNVAYDFIANSLLVR